MRFSVVIAIVGLAACDTSGAGGGGSGAPKVAESGTKRGSAGGFSATMSAELAKQNVEPAPIAATAPVAKATTGSGATTPGTATSPVGSPSTGTSTPATKPGSPAATGSAATQGATQTPGTQSPSTQSSSSATGTTGTTKLATPPPDQASAPSTPTPGAKKNTTGVETRVPAKPSGDIAAIKMDLEPNWERDMGEAATFSLVVKVPPTNEERVFYAHYGYEDQASPVDCDAYRKFLEDKKIMTVTLNRQRGAACYVEGTDASGAVYRYLLVYGGKHLTCGGSLYKEQALGDLRDKVLMQAKKICETLAL